MAARIRTLNFLPEVFQTPTNAQFLGATLDQIVDQPNTMRIQGYIGSKFGYGINAKDNYVIEPTKVRTDYQLDPGVVFTKTNTATATDFITYPGIVDALKLNGGVTNNNDRLFNSQFYSWDPFVDLDKLINFNQYYWLPEGAPAVPVGTDIVYNVTNYTVVDEPNAYNISSDVNPSGAANPTITLIRGGTYTFNLNQDSPFWIQGAPGVTGYDPSQPNIQTRDVLGVSNNGAEAGIVEFSVPYKNAQDEYVFPGNNLVDVVSTAPFDQINGQRLSVVKDIDGVTSLNGLTVMFYNTGVPNETGYVSKFYDSTLFDEDGGASYTPPGSSIDYNNFEGGYYTDVSATFYTITYVSAESGDPVLSLVPVSEIPTNEKITATYGVQWKARNFYRNIQGTINLVPYLSSLLDTLYYQDGTVAGKVGVIKLIDSNLTNQINVLEILGKQTYTSPNGVVFTNGLKVTFDGDIFPVSYKTGEYYVQGVGTAIELINTTELIVPEPFTEGTYNPYDIAPYDIGNYDVTLYIPVRQDYITIARNSIDKNPWSRSNRWFHIDVINATAGYLNNPAIATTYATQDNKAKRPVIEFYPNLKLFDNCIVSKQPIDFFDVRTTDAFTQVAGQTSYYPDVEVYTSATASITSASSATSTTVTVSASNIGIGAFQVGQYITDSAGVLPRNSQITAITGTTTLSLTVGWSGATSFSATPNVSLVANDISNDNYSLYDGARIVFSVDSNEDVKNKIYTVRFSSISGSTPVITLTEAEDGLVLPSEGTFAFKGYYNQGKDFYYAFNNDPDVLANEWQESQQKTTVNQAPLFDIFDTDGVSFGDKTVYTGSSFIGNKLFSYGIGSGINDIVLGFPIRYSSVNNVGDISFDVPLNSATFDYVRGSAPITQNVNTGYVHNYSDLTTRTRALGWQTAVAESRQYQVFSFNYVAGSGTTTYSCDIAAATDTVWPNIQVYVNNVLQDTDTYTYTINANTTVINFTVPDTSIDTVVEITIISDQVSATAYYQVPINLQNNPLNADITTANVGDIRGQYQSIFYNNPNTTGKVFGANNYRDLGNLVPWGNRIIQNSASLVLPGALLRKPGVNLYDSLQYNSNQYITFKTLLMDTVNATEYTVYQTPAVMLDDALDQITDAKVDTAPFFWSDMLPSKSAYTTNTYTFANSLDVSRYPLTRIYNFDTANYYGVLVYLTRTVAGYTSVSQLIIGVDYTISADSPSLTVSADLLPGDIITVKEYYQTYGSYVPNTPTKLGLYPSFIPEVILDSNYTNPTYFIRGHDGSYTKLYGDYIDGHLVDFRDKVLLEFETRIYNNLKLSNIIPVRDYDVVPGFFRTTDYSYNEFLEIYSQFFLNWVGQNRVEYKAHIGYTPGNEYSYNYSQSGNKINKAQIQQGYWRGVYQYFYDTSQPDVAPWEMIGLTDQPTWWTERYGPAPYTGDNLVLWGDLAAGINWNNGDPVVVPQCVRPELLQVIPVDSAGNLLSPFDAIVGNYDDRSFRNNWKVGDVAPTEFAYRRSSSWPFDLMKILALTKPAEFYNLGVDVDNYKYNEEFNQFLVNDRSHLIISDIEVYGSGTAKTSYLNWTVDYEKQVGIDSTQTTTDLLKNLDVRLIYRTAGFTDKTLVNFYVEKGTPNSRNASLLIPTESFNVLLYDNIPFDKITYSSVIVQNTANGWKVFGNSQTKAYFTVSKPKINGNYNLVKIENESVQVAKNYFNETLVVPYGTEFLSKQDVAQFLASYGNYLLTQGVLFDQIESGLDINWNQMVAEYLYWTQSGWEVGSLINLNPAANLITVDKDSYVVQPLTLQRQNFVLNQNLYPIQAVDLAVVRDGTLFSAKPLNQGDTVAYGQFNISNFEHGIVFDNVTLFNDVIYNLITGLRQNRITVRGTKTADWNGTIDAQGFILNQDNIQEWNNITKYTKGSIVKYKNKYWVALKVLEPSMIFDAQYWKETDYDEVQKGLLPNPSTRSYESTLYYDTNTPNLSKDADLLSWSLIGYRPRDYMALADLTDITQVNVYKNLIKEKGTRIAAESFRGITLPQGGIDYDIYENWAIKTGDFGGVLDNNFVDFKLNQNDLTSNPSIVGLTNGVYTEGVQQEVPLYSVFNYGRPITDPNVLPTLPANTPNKTFPDAGYVNFNDITVYGYYYNDLNLAQTPLDNLYVGEYVWLADYQGTWQVYTPIANGNLIQVINNLNGTVTLEFAQPHNLSKYQTIAIINFNSAVNGYRIIQSVVDNYKVTVSLALVSTITRLTGFGTVMRFQSQRVDQPSDINNLPLLNAEFVKNKVWVDTNSTGDWAVYRKSINYQYDLELLKTDSNTFGSAVATTSDLGYLVGDADDGKVYRYIYNAVFKQYEIEQTITGDASFGSAIAYAGAIFAISQPTGATSADRLVKVYSLITTTTQNTLSLLQTISASNLPSPHTSTNFGSTLEMSGDGNWLYVSSYVENKVYVYRKSQVTGLFDYSTYITVGGLTSGDNFGFSISTNYYGNSVTIGAPGIDTSVNNTGEAYIYERLVQNFEAQYTSQIYVPQTFSLVWTPTTVTQTATATASATDRITITSSTGFNEGDPVVFSTSASAGYFAIGKTYTITSVGTTDFVAIGAASNTIGITFTATGAGSGTGTAVSTGLLSSGAIAADTVYYVYDKPTSTTFRIASTRDASTPIDLAEESAVSPGSMTCTIQTTPLLVTVNGTIIDDNNYAVIGSTFYVYSGLTAGDIITVSGSEFILTQELVSTDTVTIGEQYGYSADFNTYGTELLIGSPFQINTDNKEGAIYRYTDGGGKYGVITATTECDLGTASTILLNGYAVAIPAGDAIAVSNAIAAANLTNITATPGIVSAGSFIPGNTYTILTLGTTNFTLIGAASNTVGTTFVALNAGFGSGTAYDNFLTIQLLNIDLATVNDKLDISVLDSTVLTELGITKYTATQTITDPHPAGRTQFGTVIKFNDFNSFVTSAPVAARYEATTFDATDDDNYNNDTLFDNNTTQFVDVYQNAGAVYMFDYVENYDESLTNVGQFVYAQSVNALNEDYGAQPYYGTALDFNDNSVVIGTPNFRPSFDNGQVVIYKNASGLADWSVFREPETQVDVAGIQNAQLYSASTNNTLINLDYFDPLQGKILGAVAQNLDIISNADPASYNSPNVTAGSSVWGAKQVGQLWFNTSTTKFVNYHQNNDVVYNSEWWGRVFPGSQVTVYSWITSNVIPALYTGPGTPYSIDEYAVEYVLNSTGAITPVYFYWVRNTNIIFNQIGKTLSDTICESYISAPQSTGISYFAPLQSDVMGLYNCGEYINGTDTVMHIGFATGTNDDVSHSVYSLIRSGYADDFLPGLPTLTSLPPLSLYDRMLDSMSGVDETGEIVPDPYLPKPVQSGILARPRQSFFYNRFGALKNYLTLANQELAKIPFTETQNSQFLYTTGPINPSTGLPFYETTDYWTPTNWWATGYSDNTRSALLVESYYELATINAQNGLIVTVNKNGAGLQETYIYDSTLATWVRIGLQNGTIQFKSDLWDYETARLGFGDNFFDTTPFDTYPSEETRSITRFLNEELPGEMFYFRNQGLILLFNYIVSETIESQNYLPWLSKTSFIDVAHTIRELLPLEVYQSDNQDFLSGYINEVKPYHVVVKDFLFKYTGIDLWAGNITDFDLPAQYNTSLQQYITPELVYSNQSGDNQYLPTNAIWQEPAYTNWFNNYGTSITGVLNNPITVLSSYLTLNSNSMVVDNIYGFPINGVIKIYNPADPETDLSKKSYELIAYSSVDRAYGTLNGLTRGVNETTITSHLPGQQIYIDLPAVLVLDGGRGYANPPKVTAYIDTTLYPAPRREAILEPVMNLDSILRIDVVDPGDGYVVTPQIVIEPSAVITFGSTDVDTMTSTIAIDNQLVQTGDLVQYYVGTDTTPIGGLKDGQYYYINVLETSPAFVIALYTSYADALQDRDRVVLVSTGTGTNNNIAISARASCVMSSRPIRENITTLRYDRTTYTSQVSEWAQGNFYGSFYAGSLLNSEKIASSSIIIAPPEFNYTPPIDSILASAQGATFEIQNIRNDEVVEWSSRTRIVTNTTSGTNLITITPSEGGTPDEGYVGPTTGFYVGMPIQFTGAGFGGLSVNTVYYVRSIENLTQFSIEDSGGTEVTLSTASTAAGLTALIGEVTNTAVVTIQYPGILNTTATAQTTNYITIPLNASGLAGTTGFYQGLPVFFTGTTFGNIIENENYYVTTVVDAQTITISKTNTPTIITVEATVDSGDWVVLDDISDLEINTPVIVNNMVISGASALNFGGIVSGQVYYVADIDYSGSRVTLSTAINSSPIALTTVSAASNTSAVMTSQADVVQLTTATGSMTCNVGLPISPGQIDGQQFTFYNTSGEFTNSGNGYSGTNSNLITRDTVATVDNSTFFPSDPNYLYLNVLSGGLTNIYVNMPFVVADTIGTNLIAGTTYYVQDMGTTTTDVTSSSSSTNIYSCDSTLGFYVDMPISFTGGVFGGVEELVTYYIESVISDTTFTISDTRGGSIKTLTTDNGLMLLTADNPYITVSATSGGSAITNLTTDTTVTTFTQDPDTATPPTFFINYALGGYSVVINDAGLGFAYDNNITIAGADVGGTTGINDIIINVSEIDETNGSIISTIVSGTPPGLTQQYYLKVISATELEVYSNPLLTVPVNGDTLGAIYNGVKSTGVTAGTASTDAFTVTDSTIFSLNDPIVFTGTVFGGVTLGQTYYVKSYGATVNAGSFSVGTQYRINTLGDTNWNTAAGTVGITYSVGDIFTAAVIGSGTGNVTTLTQITISSTIAGSTFNIVTNVTGSMTVAKSGDYVFLPEPFYFTQSIVRYNNKLYQCIVSNNDNEFILGKWELLDSGDRKLNELDRIVGYYNPTVNMPGRDLTQLVSGITYPGSTYLDNAFPPAEEFLLDTVLQDQAFYPATINNIAVVWNGTRYTSISTASAYTALLTSETGNDWTLTKLSNNPVGVTDLVYNGTRYVITSSNSATPIYTSTNGLVYTTGPSLTVPATTLTTVNYSPTSWVAVGDNVITSVDTITWTETYTLTNVGYFTDVMYTTEGYTGWLAIGNQTVSGVDQTIIIRSTDDGVTWNIVNDGVTTVITSAYVNAMANGDGLVVIVGDSGQIFTSTTGAETNTEQTSGTSENLVDVIYANGTYVAVGENGTIVTSSDASTWTVQTGIFNATELVIGKTYSIETLGDTDWNDVADTTGVTYQVGDSIVVINLGTGTGTASYTTTNNLNGVSYNDTDSEFIVVGDNNTILTSSDASTWTSSTLFIQEEPVYTVQGDSFTEGYGPEELVPGVVTDNLTMIVTTLPGTNWPVGQYGHTGFTVVSEEITPTVGQTEYSFLNIVQNPAFIAVYDIDPATGLSTRIYENYNYTVDWVTKTITLDTALAVDHTLGIDLYEVGNGYQLQRSNSQTVPFINRSYGYTDIPLNCNYSANKFNGNGLIRPGTEPLDIECIETEASTNSITCLDVSNFSLNEPIIFQGTLFGGITADQIYYVKTISYVTNKITVSLPPLVDGIAGPTFPLTDATGSMQAIIQTGTGIVWADPLVVHNGVKLTLGETSTVTETKSGSNSVVVNTSLTMDVNDPVVFCNCITFTDITPLQVYYIKSIVDANEFTISETPGGSTVVLPNATGLANCITNDYAIDIADVGLTAKLVFPGTLSQATDFVTFAVFGETEPAQYSYSVPETQVYQSTGGETQLLLSNYIGGVNPDNAVVELNGLRLINVSDYTIDLATQTIYLTFSLVNGDILAITTFNSTDRQYLDTTLGGTFSGSSSITLVISDATHLPGFDESDYGGGVQTTAGSFTIGQGYIISTINDGLGGADTDFTLVGASNNDIGTYFIATGVGAGTGDALESTGEAFSPGPDYLTLDSGYSTESVPLNSAILFSSPIGGLVAGVTYYIVDINSLTTAGNFLIGSTYEIETIGTTDFTLIGASTNTVGELFTATGVGSGTGTATNRSDFVVSETPEGEPVTLTTESGTMVGLINPPSVSSISAVNNEIIAPVFVGITDVNAGANVITCASTAGFALNQTIMFKSETPSTPYGNLLCNGTVYYISNPSVSLTEFTVSETYSGPEFDPSGVATGAVVGEIGGNPAVSITTSEPHNLEPDDIVRIDGTSGSLQLNNNTYYAKVINSTQIALYNSAYNPAVNAINDPVTVVSTWTGGGYVWLDKQFTLTNATAIETFSADNTIEVTTVDTLVLDTPVYFAGSTFGNIVEGTRYYVKSINVGDKKITISATYQGEEFVLADDTGSMGVTMWEQANVDRIWVTVNGYRIPSSALYLNPDNNLSILTEIVPGDVVIITNMIPTATPDELTYINNVNKSNEPTVYRATSLSTTWLTEPLSYTDSTIYVEDVTKITTSVVLNETATVVSGLCSIGLSVDKRIISQVIVVNNTTSTTLSSTAYSVQIIDTAPVLEITSGVSTGNSLTITVILGNLIYVAGEQIKFTTVDFDNNTLTGLQRGTNGTGERNYIPAYEKVYGILSTNQLPAVNYNLTWNSDVYNPTLGDPLQISTTASANFLNAEF